MDLVSSTLHRYLKHRFNVSAEDRNSCNNETTNGSVGENTSKPETLVDNNSSLVEPFANIKDAPQEHASNNQQTNGSSEKNSTCVIISTDTVQSDYDICNLTPTITSHELIPSPATTHNNNSNNNSNYDTSASNRQEQLEQPMETSTNIPTINGITDCEIKLPDIHNISIANTQPCCVSIRDDLRYLAAGFENSHIYLWTTKQELPTDISDMKIYTLLAHSGPVYSIEFVSNNDLMLSCSEDTTIRLWCLNSKCNIIVYRGHSYPIWSLDVGLQGKYFASASMDSTARLWRLDILTPIRIFCGHHDDVECLKFHPNEKYIATGSSDSTVRLWSISDGKMVRLMVGHKVTVISLSFFPNGKFLASASRDGTIKVWNLATNLVSKEFSVPASYTISFSPEHKFVSSCGVDNIFHLWQVDNTKLIERKQIDFRPVKKIIKSQFHRDNKLFILGHLLKEEKT